MLGNYGFVSICDILEVIMTKELMDITEDEFVSFLKAKEHIFPRTFEQPGMYAIERCKKSGLKPYKYLYILENFESLSNRFNGRKKQ